MVQGKKGGSLGEGETERRRDREKERGRDGEMGRRREGEIK
jgi:hypothetical protein